MTFETEYFYEFGPFRLDSGARLLLRDGEPVQLTPKALETLLVLVERGGQVVGREDLIREVWPDTFVEENNLSVNVSMLRRALGAAPDGRPYIETLPRRGYRFAAKAIRVEANGSALLIEKGVREQFVVIEEDSTPELLSAPAAEQKKLQAVANTNSVKWSGWYSRKATLILVFSVMLLAAVAGFFLYVHDTGQHNQNRSVPAIKSIAVLPFKSLNTPEQSENYLGVGLADALITRLGGLRQISVRPTSSVLRFDDHKQDSLTAARALGVDAVLEGSYQLAGERIRVTVQLVSARDGTQLWSGTFNDEFRNIFAVQDSISTEATEAFISNLDETERRLLAKRPTSSVEAYQEYLKGRHFWNKRTGDGLYKAVEYFNRAIDVDPLFARAHAGLADSYALLSYYAGAAPSECFPKAKAAAKRALELDETLAEAHASLAYSKLNYDWEFNDAEKEFRRALELAPDYATAHFWYGELLAYQGRFAEAITEMERAQELDPLSMIHNAAVGWVYAIARQPDRAIEQLHKTLEMDQNFHMAHFYLGMAYEQKGMSEQAIAAYQKSVDLSGGYPGMVGLGHAYAVSGQQERAQEILGVMLQGERSKAKTKTSSTTGLAIIYAGLEDRDHAFEWLERGYEKRYEGLLYIKVHFFYDNLRSDPRLTDLLRRVGLAD